VLTDSPESQKGDLAGGSCLAQCVLLKTHCCASATCPPKAFDELSREAPSALCRCGYTHPVSTWPVALARYAVPATAKMLDAVLAHG
jgi:hypothetical protein